MAEFSFFQQVQAIAAHAKNSAKEAHKQISTTANQVYTTTIHAYEDVTPTVTEFTSHVYTTVEEKTSGVINYIKEQTETIYDGSPTLPLNEIGRKVASLGTPAIAFAVAASIAGGMGLAGGAVITTSLAMLGGPFGMVGGLITLGVLTVIADAVSKYGIDAVLIATFKAKQEQGIPIVQIQKEINDLWLSDELKLKIQQQLNLSLPSQSQNNDLEEASVIE